MKPKHIRLHQSRSDSDERPGKHLSICLDALSGKGYCFFCYRGNTSFLDYDLLPATGPRATKKGQKK